MNMDMPLSRTIYLYKLTLKYSIFQVICILLFSLIHKIYIKLDQGCWKQCPRKFGSPSFQTGKQAMPPPFFWRGEGAYLVLHRQGQKGHLLRWFNFCKLYSSISDRYCVDCITIAKATYTFCIYFICLIMLKTKIYCET